jgi:hypothetical protein
VEAEVSKILPELRRRALELRTDHQAFILTPLFRYLVSKPWRPKDPSVTQLRGGGRVPERDPATGAH